MVRTDAYLRYIQPLNPYKIKFLDEAGVEVTDGRRKFGHSLKGRRAVEIQKYLQQPNNTLTLLVGLTGVKHCSVIEDPSNTAWYIQFLTDAMNSYMDNGQKVLEPGDVIIADNAKIHHGQAEQILRPWLHQFGITYQHLKPQKLDF